MIGCICMSSYIICVFLKYIYIYLYIYIIFPSIINAGDCDPRRKWHCSSSDVFQLLHYRSPSHIAYVIAILASHWKDWWWISISNQHLYWVQINTFVQHTQGILKATIKREPHTFALCVLLSWGSWLTSCVWSRETSWTSDKGDNPHLLKGEPSKPIGSKWWFFRRFPLVTYQVCTEENLMKLVFLLDFISLPTGWTHLVHVNAADDMLIFF